MKPVKASKGTEVTGNVEPMLRKQYLIPRAAAKKVEQISRKHKVSAAEVVRRAIESYEPSSEDFGEAELLAFLEQTETLLSGTVERIDAVHADLTQRLDAIERGEQRDEVRNEVRQWAAKHPEGVEKLARLFFSPDESGSASEPPESLIAKRR